jgi:hypothetical protein
LPKENEPKERAAFTWSGKPDYPSLIDSFGARQNSGYRPQTVPERHPNEPAKLGCVKWLKQISASPPNKYIS